MKRTIPLILVLLIVCGAIDAQKKFNISSPDGRLTAEVVVGKQLTWSLAHDGQQLIEPSAVSLTLADGEQLGPDARVRHAKQESADETISSPFWISSEVRNTYNELAISFRGDWGITFRLYDDGLAYRFRTSRKGTLTIAAEEANFRFTGDRTAWVPYVKGGLGGDQLQSSFENTYVHTPLSQIDRERLIFLPLLADASEGKRLLITEADLESYPGMYLTPDKQTPNTLRGLFARVPAAVEQGGHNMLQMRVTEREEYIAKTEGSRSFPWRVCLVTDNDASLAASDMVYRLASPSRLADTSWIKPGKVAWEWWNDWNIHDVDFKSGINNDTYKYYIDFASEHGIEYVILDEGWAVNLKADLMQVIPEINIPELVAYGRDRGVGIILWAGYHAFDRDMEEVCRHYAAMGVKGFKVDFMDRDDQELVEFIYRAAETAARHKLLLDFHGIYKPTGLSRTWPNVLNFEGVHGLEQLKWSPESIDMVNYDVTVPFIRMVAGPMDYTQGAMRNAARGSYRPVNSEPMSQGTRCRQLALYVVFNSPINMLCDSPTEYMLEPESLEFIASIPTVWDETVPLTGRVGEHVTLARRSGSDWYIGGITGWESRDMTIDFSFLPAGQYEMTLFRDGANAHRKGADYRKELRKIESGESISLHLAPGGGFAAKLRKI
ncbi:MULTISPECIES: glycoside hydrolase family 97 protein [Proteiniphilum]|jgi:alpha-glucosidase|uniref:glycoside hydrolase family 97 protein n=1 Tax=Proteiniphilum TaxID=294702 RepID=UPI001EEAEA22|nr:MULTISPECIES: glycoside hydrolase family 97 protein [Proteiniphilum]ULB33288.1 glycoside hydrolase family 97 protein [Proteiniphilum propionicum]